MFPWHQYVLALLFIIGGFSHFRKPKIYEKIIPPYIPAASSLVLISGVVEMIVGFMLITQESVSIGAWAMIVLLILFFPVHIHMLQHKEASLKLPSWVLWLRLFLQFALIYWAYQYV